MQIAIYNVLILLFALGCVPKLIGDWWQRKKGPSLLERLGIKVPEAGGRSVIWIHAVSVGETKAAQPLFLRLKKEFPEAFFLVTHATWTGREEAKRSLGLADAFAFLPLDFSWIMRRWVKRLRPTYFVLVEGDFWFNQLSALKRGGAKIVLASGKISERSARRFGFVSFFAKRLFGLVDLFCVQSEEHAARFAPFVREVYVAGNLKFDVEPQEIEEGKFLKRGEREVITIACTHDPEEKLLLEVLEPMFSRLTIFLAPRHPERFDAVEKLLVEKKISFVRLSQLQHAKGKETVILVDAMGQLPFCYANSRLAFVGGSFTDRIGGHNVLEPCLYGCPSLFGPYMQGQRELTSHVLRAGAGRQIAAHEALSTLELFFSDPAFLGEMKQGANLLFSQGRGSAEKTIFLMREKRIWQ